MENKPLIVIADELREKIFSAVNDSGLSPTIVGMILKDIYADIKNQCDAYDRQQRDEWQKSQESENTNTIVSEPNVVTK